MTALEAPGWEPWINGQPRVWDLGEILGMVPPGVACFQNLDGFWEQLLFPVGKRHDQKFLGSSKRDKRGWEWHSREFCGVARPALWEFPRIPSKSSSKPQIRACLPLEWEQQGGKSSSQTPGRDRDSLKTIYGIGGAGRICGVEG